ncbi:hypothetical protein GCM10010833_33500 [Blastomonas aquatica]|uniref:Class I SAM-dependent methyltransferase n=2 Tax=Blastomonas aquatica TaxID=1510276 RepID=A0ABQ1JRP9_9SPHN|nr:hypothetical protein GCM10010833_33500 [Blastomonas aquatica]
MYLIKFVESKLYRIRGFMHPTDAFAFAGILSNQADRSIKGMLVEIGVFYGRSFSLLALHAKASGSVAVGIDLFDIAGQQSYVDNILAKLDVASSAAIIAQPSESVGAEGLVSQYKKARFFHIDGGHERHHLLADLGLAMHVMSDDCVVVFDDFMNAQYPDLSVAIIDSIQEHSESLVPFAITRAKLYTCNPRMKEMYMEALLNSMRPPGSHIDKFSFLGSEILFIDQRVKERAIFQAFAAAGIGSVARSFTAKSSLGFTRQ